jgi:YidC/Oxa1 family membrane protein insertase
MKASNELQEAMAKSNQSMTATLIPMLVQMPVFMSFFLTLRAMTNYPVPSMTQEGLFWFQNLTVPDPYYILPIVTSSTLFVILKMGIEYGKSYS